LFAVGCIFVPIGAACVAANLNVVEVSARYDNQADCSTGFFPTLAEKANRASTLGVGTSCVVSLTIPKTMKAPVFVYYELKNFYQNHRRFVKSRSDEQLFGEDVSSDFCDPQQYRVDPNGTKLEISPCGLMAWSFFNDSYAVSRVDSVSGVEQPVAVDETGIAWPSDVAYKFGDVTPANHNDDVATRGGGQINGTLKQDEHFIVWMRTAAMANFRKLWGKIGVDLAAGEVVKIAIDNRYGTFPCTTFRLCDCPYSYQKGRLTSDCLSIHRDVLVLRRDVFPLRRNVFPLRRDVFPLRRNVFPLTVQTDGR
jgi:hypothetical protein